jgi:hypothetical protein
MSKRPLLTAVFVLLLSAVAHLLILISDQVMVQAVGALLLMVAIPGYLVGEWLWGRDLGLDGLERAVLAIGAGYVALIVVSLFLSYLPGPLTRTQLLIGFDVLSLVVLGVVSLRRVPSDWSLHERGPLIGLAVILVIAAALRFPTLGYSEFQGDEGRAMLRAAEVLQGNDQVLFLHKKGPVEILLPTAIYGAAGRINEATARLPFTCANLATLRRSTCWGGAGSAPGPGWWRPACSRWTASGWVSRASCSTRAWCCSCPCSGCSARSD